MSSKALIFLSAAPLTFVYISSSDCNYSVLDLCAVYVSHVSVCGCQRRMKIEGKVISPSEGVSSAGKFPLAFFYTCQLFSASSFVLLKTCRRGLDHGGNVPNTSTKLKITTNLPLGMPSIFGCTFYHHLHLSLQLQPVQSNQAETHVFNELVARRLLPQLNSDDGDEVTSMCSPSGSPYQVLILSQTLSYATTSLTCDF